MNNGDQAEQPQPPELAEAEARIRLMDLVESAGKIAEVLCARAEDGSPIQHLLYLTRAELASAHSLLFVIGQLEEAKASQEG